MSDAEQLATLPARGRVHRDPVDTELDAAKSMATHTTALREHVLTLLREHPFGLTDDEGAQLLSAKLGTAAAHVDRLTFGRRRQELCIAGLAQGTDLRRLTPSRRKAIVWRATPAGAA